ncbi:hypothetical protein N9K06_01525 [Omnitrophica bacterium]|nr:hypothetical protein [Candidatus Omnitrophota bacterium]
MTTVKRLYIFEAVFFAVFFSFLPGAGAVGEVTVSSVQTEQRAPDRYLMTAVIANSTGQVREVSLRAQISFYLLASPGGDKPAAILRKDFELILNPGESRELEIPIINEGSAIPGAVRMDKSLRVRRQREWVYLK